jgi:protein-tyrosine phosphatase
MIDLHCHLLPGIDDGPKAVEESIRMAKIAVHDGIKVIACTPHIYQGAYDNNAQSIKKAMQDFQKVLDRENIKLDLTYGADTHLHPKLIEDIEAGIVPTLHGSRYLLIEFNHHIASPFYESYLKKMIAHGLIPIMTHPERLDYIHKFYPTVTRLIQAGAWAQITAASLTGRFGLKAKKYAIKFLVEGKTALLATDAHSVKHRPPILTEGLKIAESILGKEEASRLVLERPQAILHDLDASKITPVPFLREGIFSKNNLQRRLKALQLKLNS